MNTVHLGIFRIFFLNLIKNQIKFDKIFENKISLKTIFKSEIDCVYTELCV